MEQKTATDIYMIDAKGKRLGRVASEAARVLLGKENPAFVRNRITGQPVQITNASKLVIDETKREQKHYKRYSGHPGGLKEESMDRLINRKGYAEIIRKAVAGMLPKNKLRPEMLRRLEVSE